MTRFDRSLRTNPSVDPHFAAEWRRRGPFRPQIYNQINPPTLPEPPPVPQTPSPEVGPDKENPGPTAFTGKNGYILCSKQINASHICPSERNKHIVQTEKNHGFLENIDFELQNTGQSHKFNENLK